MSDDNSDTVTISDANSLTSSNFLNKISKRFKCDICNRKFTTRYSLERHNETFHDDDSENASSDSENVSSDMEEDSETQGGESMSEDESSEEESSEEESSEEDKESSEDEDSDDEEENHMTRIFRNLFKDAYNRHADEINELIEKYSEENKSDTQTVRQAFLCCDKAKKTFRRLFAQSIADISEQRRHPLYKAIMEKAKKLTSKGFTEQEAISSAVDYRKHGIDNLIKFL